MTDELLCKGCGKPYETKYYDVMGLHILRGEGNCPACCQVILDEQEAKELAVRQAELASRRRAARSNVGIPPRFAEQDFSTFIQGRGNGIDEGLKFCAQYAEEYPVDVRPRSYRSLYIFSEQSWGVGKTHLSCAIAHRILDRWNDETKPCPRVRWVSEPQLFSQIEASFNYTLEEKQVKPNKDAIINSLIQCDLLILDDVGKEKRQDPRFVQRTLFAIINGRYDRDFPIVITANLKPSLLKGHLGTGGSDEASYDRFVEMCHGKRVQIDGKSYRRDR